MLAGTGIGRTLVFFLLASVGLMPAGAAERSVSASRQFLVFGPDFLLRGAICDLAERTKTKLLRLIEQRDEWKTPILINAQYLQANFPEAPSAALTFSQTGSGLKLQLELTVGAEVRAARVQRELLRAIILEMAYRREPNLPAGTAYVAPPDWLLDGILAVNDEGDSAQILDALGSVVRSKQILPLEQFLQQRPALLDASARSLFRAYSFALVAALTATPDGRRQLGAFIASLPSTSNEPVADLEKYFPAFKGTPESNVEKAWAPAVARFSAARRSRLLGVEETERALDEVLRLKMADGARASRIFQVEDFILFLQRADSGRALRELDRDLLLLGARANPIYRPIIGEYEQIASLLSRRKTKRVPERLAQLKTMRQRVAGRMREIDDYMNWFEATQARRQSGAFEDYMRAADRADGPEVRRRDPISVYLDTLESQIQN